MWLFGILAATFFASTCFFASQTLVWRERLASYKRIGKWYEHRVEELENETRQLAEQVLASGAVVRHAMPVQGPLPDDQYAFDPTGLVVEKLDPRDVPYE